MRGLRVLFAAFGRYTSAMNKLSSDPKRLALITISGSFLVAATWFVMLLPIPQLPVHGRGSVPMLGENGLRILACLLPCVTGLTVWFWADTQFRRAFLDDRWTEAQLAAVKPLLAHRAWVWSGLGLFAVAVIALVLRPHSHNGAFFYILIFPLQAVQRLRTLITPRTPKSSGLADWRNFGPLRSEHWGERNV